MGFSSFPFQKDHCWGKETQLIFICWLCILQLYWIGFLVLRVFNGVFRVFLHIGLCHLQTSNFPSSFPILMPFISFSCLLALASTSSTMLNRNGESGDLRFLFFPIDYDVSCGVFINGLYCIEVSSFRTYFVVSFYHEWMLNFVKCFSCIYWDDHVVFSFDSVNVMYHIDWFAYVKPTLHLRVKSHLVMMYNLFLKKYSCMYVCMYVCIWLSQFLVDQGSNLGPLHWNAE